jgi:pullulanase/glycogen debranching enzyme
MGAIALVAAAAVTACAGDEVAVSHQGNNNWYGHDSSLSHMSWPSGEGGSNGTGNSSGGGGASILNDGAKQALLRFTSELIRFRRGCRPLSRDSFPGYGCGWLLGKGGMAVEGGRGETP